MVTPVCYDTPRPPLGIALVKHRLSVDTRPKFIDTDLIVNYYCRTVYSSIYLCKRQLISLRGYFDVREIIENNLSLPVLRFHYY